MVGEIMTGLAIFKSMLDTARALKDISDAAGRNAVMIDLQEKILTAQAQYAALLERKDEIEKELMSVKAWEAEKQRYQLTDYGAGTFAYALKEAMSNGEPPHRLCAKCYQEGHKSILQFFRKLIKQEEHYCPRCKITYTLGAPSDPKNWPSLPMGGGPNDWMR